MIRPTEELTVKAAAAVIAGTLVDGLPLATKVVPRWILALAVGEAISHLAKKDDAGNLLPVNSWVLTTASWIPAKVKSESGMSQTPTNIEVFPDIFAAPGNGDTAKNRDYKIVVTGSLKIWQLVQYKQGNDNANSELQSMKERQAVIDKFSGSPRLGMNCLDFEHDELKIPSIAILPFDDSLLHVAQGNLPFTFSYVVSAT